MELRGVLLVLILAAALPSSKALTIGFTEVDYAADEKTGVAKVIVTVTDSPIDLNISLRILSFEEFFSNPNNKLPDVFKSDTRDPAEYSADPDGRRDFVNNGVINDFFKASDDRQSREVEIPIVDDAFNEALESFLVVIDRNVVIPEETPEYLREGIALITIVDNDPIELQFDRTVYTVHEAHGFGDDVISVSKGGVISEQILDAVVEVVELTPNTAELGTDFRTNRTYHLTFQPEDDSLPFPVTIVDDGLAEDLEQFGLVMSVANSLASIGPNNTARVVIVDSTDVIIGFEDANYTIIEGGNSDLCITVKSPPDQSLDFVIPTLIATQDGSAIETRDYIAFRRTVSATDRMCFEVVTIDNDIAEPNRNFTITVTFTPFGFSRTFITDTPSITVQIIDNDDPCGNNDCHVNANCESTPGTPGYQCVCKPGFIGDGRTCLDPCASGLNDCDVNAECRTISSAPSYECTCRRGFIGDGRTCVALCSPGSHDCHADATCTPNPNGRTYNCRCRIGFIGDGRDCKNYCETDRHRCHSSADCIPTNAGYTCRCRRGFVGNGFQCNAVCSPGTHECHPRAFCIPGSDGQSYTCQCGIGTVGNGRQCDDYCTAGRDRCDRNADCNPTFSGYQCKCRPGYTGNGFTCADANECQSDNRCDINADCINTVGGYSCACRDGFVGNGLQCTPVPTQPPPPPPSTQPPQQDDPSPPTELAPPITRPPPSTRPPLACDPVDSSDDTSRSHSRSRSSRSGTSHSRSSRTGTTGRSSTSRGTTSGTRSDDDLARDDSDSWSKSHKGYRRHRRGAYRYKNRTYRTRSHTGTNSDEFARDNGCGQQADMSRSSRSSRSHSGTSKTGTSRSGTSRTGTSRSGTSRSSRSHSGSS